MSDEHSSYIDAALAMHQLQLNEAMRSEVGKQFALLHSMYTLVESEPLPVEIESANTFRL